MTHRPDENKTLPALKLMAEYGGDCLWHDSSDQRARPDAPVGPIDPAGLKLSQALTADLRGWARWYDGNLDLDSPEDAGFKSDADRNAFEAAGRALAGRLKEELRGRWRVRYFSEVEQRLIDV